jgi:SAM-dependent methyltransferase
MTRQHWEEVYRSRKSDEQSWFQPRPEISLSLIELAGCGPSARIIDIGGGTSHLVDALLAQGYRNLSVLDIAPSALEQAKQRLGDKAGQVHWIEADITSAAIRETFDMWHDRAVFHFLTEAGDRAAYKDMLRKSVAEGGHVIIATFAEDGPTHCSGLPVLRYSPGSLLAELGGAFDLVETRGELHRTPASREQRFVYCLFQRRAATH